MIQENGHRYKEYEVFETKLHQSYDYKKNGLLNKIVAGKIHKTKNPILRYVLDYYERSLTYCMECIDILQHYKNYMKHNR